MEDLKELYEKKKYTALEKACQKAESARQCRFYGISVSRMHPDGQKQFFPVYGGSGHLSVPESPGIEPGTDGGAEAVI